MPRRGSGGPRLTARPIARVGRQTILAAWHHAIGPWRAAAGKRIRHTAWSPAMTFELSTKQDGPLRIRLRIVGPEEDDKRSPDPTTGRMKLLRPHSVLLSEPHQLRGLLSE